MKPVLLLFFLSIYTLSLGQTSYEPLLQEGNSWDVVRSSVMNGSDPVTYDATRYVLGDEVMMDSMIYYEMRVHDVQVGFFGEYSILTNQLDMVNDDFYFGGYFREDTLLKTVYRRGGASSEDKLIMDFNLEIGDSIYDENFGMWIHVVNVNWQSIDNVIRKSIGFNNGNFIMEGIGSNHGLAFPSSSFESVVYLSCMKRFNHPIWSTDYSYYDNPFGPALATINACDFTFMSMDEVENKKVSISPNPASTAVTLEVNAFSGVVILSDISGRSLKKIELKEIDQKTIDVSKYSPGLYLLSFIDYDRNSIISKRIMIDRH